MSHDLSKFANEDMPDLEDYQPVSVLSLVALLISFLSPLVIFRVELTFIPSLAVIIAVIARYQNSGTRRFVGTSAATIALIISCFAITWSAGYRISREYSVVSYARSFSDQWLDLIKEGKRYEAYELSKHYGVRQKENIDLEQMYNFDVEKEDPKIIRRKVDMGLLDLSAKSRFDKYFDTEPLKTIIEHAKSTEFEYVKTKYIDYNNDKDIVGLIYRVEGKGAPSSNEILVEMERTKLGTTIHWRVSRIREEKEAS